MAKTFSPSGVLGNEPGAHLLFLICIFIDMLKIIQNGLCLSHYFQVLLTFLL